MKPECSVIFQSNGTPTVQGWLLLVLKKDRPIDITLFLRFDIMNGNIWYRMALKEAVIRTNEMRLLSLQSIRAGSKCSGKFERHIGRRLHLFFVLEDEFIHISQHQYMDSNSQWNLE